MASDKRNSRPTRLPGKLADAVVMMGMALVTLALCIGLVLQSGLGVWLSATVAVSFYVGLLTLHTIMRRAGQLDELRAEVERLRSEIAGAQTPRAAAPEVALPASPPTPEQRAGDAAAPRPAAQAASYPAPPRTIGAASPQAPGLATGPASPPPAASSMPRATLEAGQPLGAEPATGQLADDRRQAAPPLRPAAEDGRATPAPTPDRTLAAAEAAASPAPDFAARMQRAIRNPAGTPPPPPAASSAPAGRQPFSAIKSSLPMRAPADASGSHVAAPPPVPPPAEYSERSSAVAGFSGVGANSPREADVEMIQGLIRKLAAEVDSVDAEKLGAPASDVDKALAIEASVGALKRAAETMKSPASASGAMPAGPMRDARRSAPVDEDDVDTQPLGFRRSRPQGPQSQPSVADAAPVPEEHGAPPAAEEPEFDLDKLMQRAQSIAAMTSAPPPPLLPMTPHAGQVPEVPEYADQPDREEAADDAMRHAAASAEAIDQEQANVPSEPDGPPHVQAREIDERLGRIAAALDAGRVEVLLEPILDLARQQAQHYEVSVCLRDADGSEISGGGDDEGLRSALPLLDSVRLSRTAQVARLLEERRKSGAVFSSFSGSSLDSDEFLTTFADTVEAQAGLADQLVLTFAQSDVRSFRAPQWAMVEEMRELGFRFALRAVTHLDMDFEPLARAGFAFVKLDADVFLEGLPAPGALVPAADICRHLGEFGLAVVVEHIDDEAKRQKVASAGVQLGQGQLFGGPRLVKASVLGAVGRPAAA